MVSSDVKFLVSELESMAEWFVRDWEDLLFPWIPFSSRLLLDFYVFPYTLAISAFIDLIGEELFRFTDVLLEAKRNVLSWLNNFRQIQSFSDFEFYFITQITRNVRNWLELLQRLNWFTILGFKII